MKSNKTALVVIVTVLTLMLYVSNASCVSVRDSNTLFEDLEHSEELQSKVSLNEDKTTVVRSRGVRINFDVLYGDARPRGGDALELSMFNDVSFTAQKARLERRNKESYTWYGTIEGIRHSQVIFTVENGNLAGNITAGGKLYHVRSSGGDLYIISEIDQSAYPNCALTGKEKESLQHLKQSDKSHVNMNADSGANIDVMVVYTSEAADASADIQSEIQLAIDETNQSYINSGITQRVNLVNSTQISYTEPSGSCDIYTYRNRLQNPSDGFMDEVHALRDSYKADLVMLIVENGCGYCGVAYIMESVSTTFENYGFAVTARNCATGYYSFGHEMGHIMSARHDWYVDSTNNSPFTYNHGYVDSSDNWRTVMAYSNDCGGCSRIQYWSNPDVTYGGVPMGIQEGQTNAADNRKTLNNTAYTIANFRQSYDMSIQRAQEVPVIDGNLLEYDYAESIQFSPSSGGNTATVRAVWDDEAIYIAYNVVDSQLNALETARDGGVWNDDSVEWFIDTSGDAGGEGDPTSPYMLSDDYHGIINILNTLYDSQGTPGGVPSSSWDGNWVSAVQLNGSNGNNSDTDVGYTVEVKIPWTTIGFASAPVNDMEVRMSFAVNDKDSSSLSYVMWGDIIAGFENASNWRTVLVSAIVNYFCDSDTDGYISTESEGSCIGTGCEPPGCSAVAGNDCDDNDPAVNPGAAEICDSLDNNCDGLLNDPVCVDYMNEGFDGGMPTGWTVVDNASTGVVWSFNDPGGRGNLTGGSGVFAIVDSDNGGYVNVDSELVTSALDLSGYSTVSLQFNTDFYYYTSGGAEVADVDISTNGSSGPWTNIWRKTGNYRGPKTESIDITSTAAGQGNVVVRFHYYNANYDWWWQIDDVVVRGDCSNTFYADNDNDGYGDPGDTVISCSAPAGYVADNTDCDDQVNAVNPGAMEVCDEIDNNCDGYVDHSGSEGSGVCTSVVYVEPAGICGGLTPCFDTLGKGVDAASFPANIMLAEGTYTIDQNFYASIIGGWNSDFTERLIYPDLTVVNGFIKYSLTDQFVIDGIKVQNGGIDVFETQAVITNSIISGNGVGISVYCIFDCGVFNFNNNMIFDNSIGVIIRAQGLTGIPGNCESGAFIYSNFLSNTITNNETGIEFTQNCGSSSNEIRNSIIWGNVIDIENSEGGTVNASSSNIGNGTFSGDGSNINTDPVFLDLAGDDYHLSSISPLVNAGNNAYVTPEWNDFEGDSRILYGNVDIGADEYMFAFLKTDVPPVIDGNLEEYGNAESIRFSLESWIDTVTVNQKINGGQWNYLGTYEFIAGTSGNVSLSNYSEDPAYDPGSNISNSVGADAVKFVYQPVQPLIIDNLDPEFSSTGTWSTSSYPDPYGSDSKYSEVDRAQTSAVAKWTPDIVTPGVYEVYAWWTAGEGRVNDAQYSISSTSVIDAVEVRALWDDEALYLSFDVIDSELNASELARDGNVWSEDSIEWFIDTLADGGGSGDPASPYMLPDDYHGIVNILNTRYDSQGSPSGAPDLSWDGLWDSAVQVSGSNNDNSDTDMGYTMEVKIPWSTIGISSAPAADINARMGFAVNDKDENLLKNVMWPDTVDASFENAHNWHEVMISTTKVCLPSLWLTVSDEYYYTLQSAYSAAGPVETIMMQNSTMQGDIDFNLAKTATLKSGYDCDYSTSTGVTVINGDAVVSNGLIVVSEGTVRLE